MTEILILYNFFLDNYSHIPRLLTKIINKYDTFKLKIFVHSLKETYGKNIKIRIINAKEDLLVTDQSIKFVLFSKIRLEIDRIEYLKIKQKTSETTKKNLIRLFENLKKLKTFNIHGLFIPELLEFDLIGFFNMFFGYFEILNHYIQKKKPEKVILFNCNKKALSFFQNLRTNGNVILYHNPKFLHKPIRFLNFSFLILKLLGSYLKSRISGKSKRNQLLKKLVNDNIIFIIKTKNQYNSVKPIYKSLKDKIGLNPIFYFIEYFVSFRDLTDLFRFLNEKRGILLKNKKEISYSMSFNSISLENLIDIFYNSHFYIKLTYLFNFQRNLIHFINNRKPALGIISNDFKQQERIAAGYFKLRNIPTLYIPHSAIPIIDELISKFNIKYYALGGEADIAYYLSKGIFKENISVTGSPRYENLYKSSINRLESVIDIFDGKKYEFSKNKITILLTTNPIDDKSNEKIITSVVNSLKELNLIENLIIKLHPNENGNLCKKIIQKLNINPIIIKNYNILEVINSCDLLISQKSTTLLEAMIIGTPMIVLDFINKDFKESSKYEFLNENFIPNIKNQELLTHEIKKVTEKNEEIRNRYKEYAKKFLFYDNGELPTEKIVNLILKLIKNNNSTKETLQHQ